MSETMEQRRDALYARLEKGYARISAATDGGHTAAAWERLWTDLLAEYEAVCDTLAGATGTDRRVALLREQAAEAERRRAGAQGQAAMFAASVGRRYS